ncbi:3'-5'-bisphosphate nucleotidase (plasmid) [Candidatus Megaera polyxenophila]|nr:3'-5'-bisphosphate nucleotidase [Candidatus Megaera polyxenophila]
MENNYNDLDLQFLKNKIILIAQSAGDILLNFYNESLELFEKVDYSFYTLADIESEKFILQQLMQLTPEIPVISEEAVERGIIPNIQKGNFWLVDPLDGTDGYIKGNNDFVINIALILNFSPVMGVVYIPVAKKTYVGIARKEAHVIDRDGSSRIIKTSVISSNEISLLLYHPLPKNVYRDSYLKKFHFTKLKRNSDACRFCRMAEGEFDLHVCFEGSYEWDTAAGHAIIQGAGGNIVGLDNIELVYGKKNFKNQEFIIHGELKGYKIPCFFVK